MRTEIGKIKSIGFGFGGYQDAQFGVSVVLGGKGWGVNDFRGTWADHTEYCKWTKQDQRNEIGDACLWLKDLMRDANVNDIANLASVPVEVTFNNQTLSSWRILTEVL
jgi:hypothetical protein